MSCYFIIVLLPLGPRSGECNVVSLYVLCCPVNGSVCVVCCVFNRVCELLVKQFAICLGVFVIECNGVDVCGWGCSIG